jgi:hypothetical protein
MVGSKPHDFKQIDVPNSGSTPQARKSYSYSTTYWECSDIKITFILISKTVNKMEEKWYLSEHSKLIPLLASGYFLHEVSCE